MPLVGLRGVVLGLAYLDPQAATMAWLGVRERRRRPVAR